MRNIRVLVNHPIKLFPALNVEITWPAGTYGLMKTTQGCPGGTWQSGWLEQDSEDWGTANSFSPNIYLYLAGIIQLYTLKIIILSRLPDCKLTNECMR